MPGFLLATVTSRFLHLGLALTAVALVYVPTLDGYFHGDDFIAMVDIAGKSTLAHMEDVFTFEDNNYYWRPLGQAYYRAIYEFGGLDAFWFRVANLGVFLSSLALLYVLALRLGTSHIGAIAAVLITGVFANHAVSVAWISNGARLLAALFFLVSLLALHQAIERRSLTLDCVAWLSFLAACLSDEVALALAPVLVLFSPLVFWKRESLWNVARRVEFYGIILAVLLPLQFLFTVDDEWRLSRYHLSSDVFQQSWALVSQLVLPITSADPMDVWFKYVPPVQWAAGAVAIALGVLIFALGSGTMRVLLLWIAAALAPFALWDFDVVSPRYTYLAAFPFSILVVLLCRLVLDKLKAWMPVLRYPAMATMAGSLCAVLVFGMVATMDRNDYFESHVTRYETAAESLKATLPKIPPRSRVVVYYGAWRNQDAWLEAMIQTIYRDPTITAVNVPPERVPALPPQAGPRDLILYYGSGQFTTRPPLAAR